MPEDTPLKSAYELAMEKLRAKDKEKGVPERKPLTDSQKKRIAELRQEAKAKIAEIEIMHRKKLESEGHDPEKLEELEEHLAIDKRRVDSSLESEIAKIKKEED
jgi:hypothetical protein